MQPRNLRLIIVLLAIGIAVLGGRLQLTPQAPITSTATTVSDSGAIAAAFRNRAEDLDVTGSGKVTRVLADDNDGSRHQRFILELSDGHTVLIAHNIDLAPRLDDLRRGDRVAFKGVYEWNDRGGVVHWTHHDPQGRRAGGWLEHDGRRYE